MPAWKPEELAILRDGISRGLSQSEIAQLLPDRPASAVDRQRQKFAKAHKEGVAAPGEALSSDQPEVERSASGDDMVVTVKGLKGEVSSLDDLIRVCNIDTQIWEIPTWKCKAYQGYIKRRVSDGEGNHTGDVIDTVQLFSVSAQLKAKRFINNVKAELEALLADARANMPKVKGVARNAQPGVLVSVNITDLHMGKYAWGKESGANYTVEIAEALLWEAVEDLIYKLQPYAVSKIIITVGSDLMNADNSADTTTGGTPQTTDGRQQRTFRRTWQLMRGVIARFRDIAPIHIVVINGNHDRDASFAVGEVLSVAFDRDPEVTIDNGAARRKYVEWGACLIGFDHGDECKPKDLPMVVADECTEAWGRTKWRCVETGHLHQQRVTEYPGLVVRVNPALCAPEDWHASKGFIGRIRALHAQIWDKEDGNIAQLSSSPVNPARAAVHHIKVDGNPQNQVIFQPL